MTWTRQQRDKIRRGEQLNLSESERKAILLPPPVAPDGSVFEEPAQDLPTSDKTVELET